MLSEEELEQAQAKMDGILDRLIREPDCDEDEFEALLHALEEAERALTAGLRAKLEHMKRTGRLGGAMTEAYENSVPEMISRHEAFIVVLCEYRMRHHLNRGNEAV